ncbi:hypothetical protein ABBQ32_002817 [Trebouxia sp. C0010 RCD-2024]
MSGDMGKSLSAAVDSKGTKSAPRCRPGHLFKGLAYSDRRQEARFTEYYGLQYRSTNLLLCLLLNVVWSIRGYHFIYHTEASAGAYCAALSVAAFVLQLYQIRCVVSTPDTSCSERWRGYMYMADLAACTASVVLTSGRLAAPLTTSTFVHTIHGWFTPFAGFRLSAACLLHAVNFQCYIMMKVAEMMSGCSWTVRHLLVETMCLLIFNCAVPMLLNIGYEARQRSRFSHKADVEDIKPAWAWILSVHQRLSSRRPVTP